MIPPALEAGPGAAASHLAAGRRGAAGSTAVAAAALVLALTGWNVAVMSLGSEEYAGDPSMGLDLIVLCLFAYLPLAALPVVLWTVARWLAARWLGGRRGGEAGVPFAHGWGAAGFTGALLIEIAIAGAQDGSILPGPSRLGWLPLLAAAGAAGWSASTAAAWASRSERAGIFLRRAASSGTGVLAAALVWAALRSAGRVAVPSRIVAAIASLLAGLLVAWLFSLALAAVSRRRSGPRSRRRSHAAGAAIAMGAALALTSSGPGAAVEAPAPLTSKPSIVLIVAEGLRADHVGSYGAAQARTPELDRLASAGVRFSRAYAASSSAAASTASLLSGLHPYGHGPRNASASIEREAASLARVLGEAGYATAGFEAAPSSGPASRVRDGFAEWSDRIRTRRMDRHPSAPVTRTIEALGIASVRRTGARAEEVVERALRWAEEKRGSPLFLYVRLTDTRDPYAPPPPWDAMYGRPGEEPFRMTAGTLEEIMRGTSTVGPEDLRRLTAVYDGAVSYVDDQIGRLARGIGSGTKERGPIVIVTSDHGEELNDHGELGHGHSLYEEQVRVPLIAAGPGVAAGRVLAGPVRGVDVAPTIAEAAGARFTAPRDGVSLWQSLTGSAAPPAVDVFMETAYTGVRSRYHLLRALRSEDTKLIARTFHVQGIGPWAFELYDLATDPAERHDLSAERPEAVRALWSRIGGSSK